MKAKLNPNGVPLSLEGILTYLREQREAGNLNATTPVAALVCGDKAIRVVAIQGIGVFIRLKLPADAPPDSPTNLLEVRLATDPMDVSTFVKAITAAVPQADWDKTALLLRDYPSPKPVFVYDTVINGGVFALSPLTHAEYLETYGFSQPENN